MRLSETAQEVVPIKSVPKGRTPLFGHTFCAQVLKVCHLIHYKNPLQSTTMAKTQEHKQEPTTQETKQPETRNKTKNKKRNQETQTKETNHKTNKN